MCYYSHLVVTLLSIEMRNKTVCPVLLKKIPIRIGFGDQANKILINDNYKVFNILSIGTHTFVKASFCVPNRNKKHTNITSFAVSSGPLTLKKFCR